MIINELLSKKAIARVHLCDVPQRQLGDKPILKYPEEPLDTPLCLGCESEDRSDAKGLQAPSYLGGVLLAVELFFQCPVIVVSV